MDLTSAYCSERKRLENYSWKLVSTLSALTERLMMLVGKDHTEFRMTKAKCAGVQREILESRERLRTHRSAHGC